MTVKAADPDDYLELVAVVEDASGNKTPVTETSLEIGDKVMFQLKATQKLEDMKFFSSIEAYLEYDSEQFKQVVASDFKAAKDWSVYWDKDKNKLQINTAKVSTNPDTDAPFFRAGEEICTLTMTVKRSVSEKARIGLKGDLTDASKTIVIIKNDDTSRPAYANNLSCEVDNSKDASTRVFMMDTPDKVTFYTDIQGKQKEILIPIAISSGLESVDPVYCGFRFGFTFNSNYVTYNGYELSSQAGAYVQSMTISNVINNNGLHTYNVALVSSKDINLAGEFIYLKFMTNPSLVAQPSGVNISITLYDVANESDAPMTMGFVGGTTVTLPLTSGISVPVKQIVLEFKERTVYYGDVNGDSKINLIDALMIMQHYNGVRTLSQVEGSNEVGSEWERADVNRSNSVTLVDALLILKYYNGEISSFPLGG